MREDRHLTYRSVWADDEGRAYREEVYARQSDGGTKPLTDNPTIAEVVAAISFYEAKEVLEVGCGWGRILAQIAPRFQRVVGCDIAQDLLDKVPEGLMAAPCDIGRPGAKLVLGRFDVVFSRGVLHYLLDDPEAFECARHNMALMARRRVILWELPEVCDRLASDSKFECRRIERRDE